MLAIGALLQATAVYADWGDSEQGLPLIDSFPVASTRAKGAVWAFAPGPDGRLWVGSDQLLLFDGENTEVVATPETSYVFRALGKDANGQVWAGGIGTLGRLESDETGMWRYSPMNAELQSAGIDKLGDVWAAVATADGVAFVTDNKVLRWNGSKFETWDLPGPSRLIPCRSGNELWLYLEGTGLLRMEKDGPKRMFSVAELPATPVTWILGKEDALIVGTSDAVYSRQGGAWRKLDGLSAAVAGKLPFCAVSLDGGRLAVGTFLEGIVLGKEDGSVLAVIDRSRGLPNDNIHALWADGRNNLWVGYEGGMSRIPIGGATSIFDRRNGLLELPVEKVLAKGGSTYVLTHKALYQLSAGKGMVGATLQPEPGLNAYLWDAAGIGPNLWVSGFGGAWRMDADHLINEHGVSADVFKVLPAPSLPDDPLLLENYQLKLLYPSSHGGWASRDLGLNVGDTPLSVLSDDAGGLWVSTIANGIFHFGKGEGNTDPPDLRSVQHFQIGVNLPKQAIRSVLTKLGGRVFAFTQTAILEARSELGDFVPVEGMADFVGIAGTSASNPEAGYWLLRRKTDAGLLEAPALVKVEAKDGSKEITWTPMEAPGLDHAGQIGGIYSTSKGKTLWLAGSDALLRVDSSKLQPAGSPPTARLIRILLDGTSIANGGAELKLSPESKRIRFQLSSDDGVDGEAVFFQSKLGGLGSEWSVPQREPSFEYTGLRSGRYSFEARALDRFGRTGPIASFSFILPAPWYQTWQALTAYASVILLLVAGSFRWRDARLRKQNVRLNQLIDERTRELALANSAKNEFLENISHEIRNPLNGIGGLVEMLRDANLPPEERRLAKSLRACADTLTQVFEEVLGFSKLEYGYVELESSVFSLTNLIHEVEELFTVQAKQQKSSISVEIASLEDASDGFRGDARKIKSIVGNFVSNALKYAPGSPVDISVECKDISKPTHADGKEEWCQIRFSVTDRGQGLSAEEQALIFRKFVRGANAKESGIAGTGLGLATCRMLAKLMDGDVGVVSPPKGKRHGAAFWLEIPLPRASLPKQSDKPETTSAVGLGQRALIVEDQEYNQIVLRGISKKIGFEADVAGDASEALRLVDTHSYEVVFLDWELPGMKGGELAQRLRRHPNGHLSIIVATTAHDSDEIRGRCRESGMDGFVLKPFDAAKMRAAVAEATARKGDRPSLPTWFEIDSKANGGSDLTLNAFSDFASGDPSRTEKAVDLYLSTLDQEMAGLARAVAEGNAELVASCAHRVRSHAGLVNGRALNEAAGCLQNAAKSGNSAGDYTVLFEEVRTEAENLKAAISEKRENPGDGI